ncbi:mRNA-decapping enzyme 1B [Ambystoma mexicanum]|uniref:mRNA-decapping enzyme 1B n=1 Tax=Ambystoma mexicanum TaxID=8296 RepID=UPI0037E8D784
MASSGAVMSGLLLEKGLDISLAALRRHDPYIRGIVDVASQVALYTFSHTANEWEKTDVEGTLFVYTRSASPKHGFTIMNRLSMENRTEPITKDLDFQLQDPFLLYKNARFSIYGIWFYDKEECQRIAELMKNLTQEEQLKARHDAGAMVSPMNLNAGDSKEVDILQMLTKAKDEYTKCTACSEPKQISSSTSIYDNPKLIKPIPVKPKDGKLQTALQQGDLSDSEPQHLSLMALFGKQNKSTNPAEQLQKQQPEPLTVRQGVARSLFYEEPDESGSYKNSTSQGTHLCPAIQKLMVRGTELHSVSELPENRLYENGSMQSTGDLIPGLFQPVAQKSMVSSLNIQDLNEEQTLLQTLHVTHGPVTKLGQGTVVPVSSTIPIFSRTQMKGMTQPQPVYFNNSIKTETLRPQSLGTDHSKLHRQPFSFSANPPSTDVLSPQELLKKLHIVQQEQQFNTSNRPALAAKFPTVTDSTATLKPLHSWMDKTAKAEKQNPLFQVISPQRIPATVAPALLMSPMVFTHSVSSQPKTSTGGRIPLAIDESTLGPSSLLLPLQGTEHSVHSVSNNCINSSTLTKLQLQETLVHLIQNDDHFLNAIYDAYLSSLRKGSMNKKM